MSADSPAVLELGWLPRVVTSGSLSHPPLHAVVQAGALHNPSYGVTEEGGLEEGIQILIQNVHSSLWPISVLLSQVAD